MKYLDKCKVVGWIAVGLSIVIICFWAFWGIIENFHEGWYYASWLSNVGLIFVQYLSPMLIFMGVTLISIAWPRFGGGLHVIFANFAWLLGVTLYWFATFFLYVEFLEIVPATGKRRLSATVQKWVIGFEIAVAIALIGESFVVADVPADFRLYGMVVYGGLVLATFILIHTPLVFQRTTAVIALVCMIVIGLFLSPPAGFQ